MLSSTTTGEDMAYRTTASGLMIEEVTEGTGESGDL